mgnify:CR=1 FL=1|tara:strand:- start:249 stop:1265 length:1017 start_codon:yes stop_codon:yes gene_type:complete
MNKRRILKTIDEYNRTWEQKKQNENKAKNTVLSYEKDFNSYKRFCEILNRELYKLDYDVVTAYLQHLFESPDINKYSTIRRQLFSINYFFKKNNIEFDTKNQKIIDVLSTIKSDIAEKHGGIRVDKTPPLLFDDMKKIIKKINQSIKSNPKRLINYRDKSLILIAWYGAFRRSEVSNLDCNDIIETDNRLIVTLKKSKTDQDGKKQGKPIARIKIKKWQSHCPVNAYNEWLKVSNISSGKVFRHIDSSNLINHNAFSDRSVAQIIFERGKEVNIKGKKLSGHSFRSGYATQLAMDGASIQEIMEITQHSSENTARGYIQMAKLYRETASEKYIHKKLK